MLGAKCGFAPSRIFLRKPSDRAECFAQTSPTCSRSFLTPRFQLADVLSAKAASCRSWFAFEQGIYYCTLRSWASRNKEPRLLSSRNSRTPTCNRGAIRSCPTGSSALACEDQTKVWRKLVSMRGYREERSLRTRLGTA